MLYIIIILIVSLIIAYLYLNKIENFNLDTSSDESGNYCSSCTGKTISNCLLCENCGLALTDNSAVCTRGNKNGKYDPNVKADQWIHTDGFRIYNQNLYPKWQYNRNMFAY